MPHDQTKPRREAYISGPMRGYAEFNFPAFTAKEQELVCDEQFDHVFSPARRDLDVGFDPTGLTGSNEELVELAFDLREALFSDCEFICKRATHIYMLPGWSKSSGATAERALGIALGLVIMGAPA